MKKKLLVSILLLLTASVTYAQPVGGKGKFLGNILSTSQTDEDFATYWNQVTPEDSGKWGSVEPTRGLMEWSVLDAMYQYAQSHSFPFK